MATRGDCHEYDNRELDVIRESLLNQHKLWHSLALIVEHIHDIQHKMSADIADIKKLLAKPEGVTKEDEKKVTDQIKSMTGELRANLPNQPSVTDPPSI